MKNKHASALGRLARGVKKTITRAESLRRAASLEAVRYRGGRKLGAKNRPKAGGKGVKSLLATVAIVFVCFGCFGQTNTSTNGVTAAQAAAGIAEFTRQMNVVVNQAAALKSEADRQLLTFDAQHHVHPEPSETPAGKKAYADFIAERQAIITKNDAAIARLKLTYDKLADARTAACIKYHVAIPK